MSVVANRVWRATFFREILKNCIGNKMWILLYYEVNFIFLHRVINMNIFIPLKKKYIKIEHNVIRNNN